jgi:hypothetical protein
MPAEDTPHEVTDDDAIRSLVLRLSRPHPSGGRVIERAAILAEGAGSSAVLTWIAAHAGEPEAQAPAGAGRGLHSARLGGGANGDADRRAPRRYVLPHDALS